MARPKNISPNLKTTQQATEKKINRLHANLSEEKLKKATTKALEPDPWTGKQKPGKGNNDKRS